VKLTTHLHLVPRSKDEWSCGAQLKHRDSFTFYTAMEIYELLFKHIVYVGKASVGSRHALAYDPAKQCWVATQIKGSVL
jgi:hypothetical protein